MFPNVNTPGLVPLSGGVNGAPANTTFNNSPPPQTIPGTSIVAGATPVSIPGLNITSTGSTSATGSGTAASGSTTGSATTGAGGSTVDPRVQSVIDAGTNSALAGGDLGANSASDQYTSQGEGLYNTTQAGQNTIDEARKSIGLNQINSIKDLMNTIKQCLQGTGVQLGNSNALDSSAAGAAARAYSNYGNVETNKINNTAADANQSQDVNQTNLNLSRDTGMATLKAFRDSSIKSIQDSAVQALSSLANTVAFLGGDASKIDVEGIKQKILDNAQSQLGLVDQHISGMISGVAPQTADQTAQSAYTASNAGAVPSGPNLPFQLDNSALTTTPAPGSDQSLIPLALKPKTA